MRMERIPAIAAMTFALLGGVAFAQESNLTLPTRVEDPVVLHLEQTSSDDMPQLLQVFVGDTQDCCEGRTPLAGQYTSEGSAVTFTPAFPFIAGQTYAVRAAHAADTVGFTIPQDIPPAKPGVTEVFPSGDTLPENTLRFYIHFASPMKPHVAFDYIQLVDAQGNVDDAAFMRFKQELWNADRTRLTLLMDPGRIKREVATNLRLGPALHAGETYELRVRAGWPTADGRAALPEFSKRFTVSAALRELPNVDQWQITPPAVGTLNPLEIRFDRPFDNQLLHKNIQLSTSDGKRISGTVEVTDDEHTWAVHAANAVD